MASVTKGITAETIVVNEACEMWAPLSQAAYNYRRRQYWDKECC